MTVAVTVTVTVNDRNFARETQLTADALAHAHARRGCVCGRVAEVRVS